MNCLAATCKVCLLPHDEEVHQATLRVKQWFRSEVNRMLVRTARETPKKPADPHAAQHFGLWRDELRVRNGEQPEAA